MGLSASPTFGAKFNNMINKWILFLVFLAIRGGYAQVPMINDKGQPVFRMNTAMIFQQTEDVEYLESILKSKGVHVLAGHLPQHNESEQKANKHHLWWNINGKTYSQSIYLAKAIHAAVLKADFAYNKYQSFGEQRIFDFKTNQEYGKQIEENTMSERVSDVPQIQFTSLKRLPKNLYKDLSWYHLGNELYGSMCKANDGKKVVGVNFSNDTLMNQLNLNKTTWSQLESMIAYLPKMHPDGDYEIDENGDVLYEYEYQHNTVDVLLSIADKGFVYREDWSFLDNRVFMNVLNVMPLNSNRDFYGHSDVLYTTPVSWNPKGLTTVLSDVSYSQPVTLTSSHASFIQELFSTITSSSWEAFEVMDEMDIVKLHYLAVEGKAPIFKDSLVYGNPSWMYSVQYGGEIEQYDDQGNLIFSADGTPVLKRLNDTYHSILISDIVGFELLVDWMQDKKTLALVKQVKGLRILHEAKRYLSINEQIRIVPVYFMRK